MAKTEFELISEYFRRDISDSELLLGIGDDAAVVQPPKNAKLAISSDSLVESVHFPIGAPPGLVARRALRVNLSDMAAMAANPKWFTLNLTLPISDADWLSEFSAALHDDAARFGCCLIGGDTTRGPLNIGIQIMGWVSIDAKYLTRFGAESGDLLVVTGTLGDAAAALDYLQQDQLCDSASYLVNRYWLPEPRVEFALNACHLINAACDISDGLAADAGHICRASGLGAEIRIADLPLSQPLKALSSHEGLAQEKALTGGDDYELCMAVPPENIEELVAVAQTFDTRLTVVGVFNEGDSVTCLDERGDSVSLAQAGFQHF